MEPPRFIENRTFDEIAVGDTASLTRTLQAQDISLFALASGDVNPAHLDRDYAATDRFHGVIAHGLWGGSLISAVLGTELPGPGTVYLSQSLRFLHPVRIGDTVTARVTVRAKEAADQRVRLDCVCLNAQGETVITGEAEVLAPADKVRRPRVLLPEVHLHERGVHWKPMIAAARRFAPALTAVVHPCDAVSLEGARAAREAGLIVPVLVGPRPKIEAAARAAGLVLDGIEIVDAPHSHAAAEKAVSLARAGRVTALMKGALHTDEILAAAIARATGLRTERRMSHVYALDVPSYPKPLFLTDAAVNIAPSLEEKRDIVQNAIDLARALGIAQPKVAILSAVETVSTKLGSTLDAAALCKMAGRGQITDGLVDGPLAFDTAISRAAAAAKALVSPVAGEADILVVPDLVSGNMLAKQLIHLAGADAAGLLLGARVPIILTSRSDSPEVRLASCALAQLFAHRSGTP
ncbi:MULTISPECIES: bifunctional enoyl-CoA hydratase/phosphate acetyltransferase [Methylobacterium]|uniref:Bifunctional enoyl-CoA hydratase/phosphate acetyltransferase n=1 Tax=Methylobacterium oryzae CBMB20 TaxID=693986 RepID=A0A089P306_9HYPH|nr:MULTISPECIES: bifunctional enoyl-CoA hydratase/phosphate acetyltransferase [Methylobacterium]KOX48856.1 bifunctional enoyl-CoA hydratase/phosphate acetyltransferase [Streptomyces purpurogeneiscleroticus]AIQ92383.1 Bifunctional enoyl-CoA hydratase/phosphate acetyltransferase [Methylobacterium oryzae CBMB20]AWV15990.1 enoyl-CoA hydratase [Methylobacterium sp. XJLW]MDH3030912.1 bifunctional enoyl-CoA hydratase/phosphate acetyltransferase [Methylobacterium fujisawaense]RUP15308.1 MAG: bifunctio